MKRYNPSEIEPKWQQIWDDKQVYRADLQSDKPKYIGMSMFNYPSGAGIHIGHAMNYTISDVMARYKRQAGYESYHPVGWDAFGLPAENFAIKSGVSPQASMAKIIPSYHEQYKAMAWSNDWSKEISTHLPEYYKWTQWIFSEMYRNGLAYQDARMQWWCEKCQTVLANEQVIDDKCWRHDAPDDPKVTKKEVTQWFFKVTEYADEMLEDTDALDWSEVVKAAQKNWIGRSEGAEVNFTIEGSNDTITVFTTRPDTIFGATFMVVAPEHPQVDSLVTAETEGDVKAYVKESLRKSELERQETKEKTGVFTGSYAINPATGEKIPVWVADYVLWGYGTGAIMAVPAHDERDYEFATKFELPIIEVVEPLYIQTTTDSKVRDDQPFVEREAITAIVRDPVTDRYLGLKWKEVDWSTFVTGGVEEGQTAEQAARAEVYEETGYKNLRLVEELPGAHSQFYHVPKKQNRFAHFSNFYFELENDESTKIADDEKSKHDVVWLTADEMHAFDLPDSHRYLWNYIQKSGELYHGEGILKNSGAFDGTSTSDAREEIVAWLEQQGLGRAKTTYKIRDWSVSRQRYWGAPIPIVHCAKDGAVLVPDDQLPVELPELEDFAPSGDGRSALARADEWLAATCPECGGPAERETDTLDTYICSSWYFLRYFDPTNDKQPFGSEIANKWMPIDFYNGGDHATAHMIYARFVTRFFHKLGMLDNPEPFKKFLFNGKVTAHDGTMFSKSKGNGIDPLEIINQGYGADALRTYLMFAAPLEQWVRWDERGVPGAYKFLNRVWNLVQDFLAAKHDNGENTAVLRAIHPTIRKVTADLDDQKYNTAIAAMMETTNTLYGLKKSGFAGSDSWGFALQSLVALVAPFAPHIADELWQQLGKDTSVQRDSWPKWDDKYLVGDTMTIVVQVNGKVRAKLDVPKDADEDTIKSQALADENIAKYLENKEPTKVIYVPGRLVSIVLN